MRATGMPISDCTIGDKDYWQELDRFGTKNLSATGEAGVVQAYAAVQRIPYFSGSDRTPLAALRSGRGACTAKHIILRDLLRSIGVRADVEIVEGDFAAGIPLHPTQPFELQEMIRQRGVTDFHCRVRIALPEGDLRLDATWPEDMAAYGFVVNRAWMGEADTLQAIPSVVVRSTCEDVLETKARLLAGIEEETSRKRLDFLRLLSGWMVQVNG